MIEEKYTLFVKKGLEPGYYELAEEMMLLHPIEGLIRSWDKKTNGGTDLQIIEKHQDNIKMLQDRIIELIDKNDYIRRELSLYMSIKDFDLNENSISLKKIRQIIDSYFDCDTTRKTRLREIVYARQMGMYFARELTTNSLAEIGREFGGKDHATVLHGVKTINNLSIYPRTRKHINELKMIFNSMIKNEEIDTGEIDKIWAY